MTRDPLGMVDGPNPYRYGANNPMTSVDPLGLLPWPWKKGCGLEYGGALLAFSGALLLCSALFLPEPMEVAEALGCLVGVGAFAAALRAYIKCYEELECPSDTERRRRQRLERLEERIEQLEEMVGDILEQIR
jgi:hypothetical protein